MEAGAGGRATVLVRGRTGRRPPADAALPVPVAPSEEERRGDEPAEGGETPQGGRDEEVHGEMDQGLTVNINRFGMLSRYFTWKFTNS